MRKSLEIDAKKLEGNNVDVRWDGLEQALQICSKRLCQVKRLVERKERKDEVVMFCLGSPCQGRVVQAAYLSQGRLFQVPLR